MSGWGTNGWGLGLWGGGGAGSAHVSFATVVAENAVRVYLSAPVKANSPYAIGDALNPNTWTAMRVAPAQAFTVVAVSAVDPSNQVFDVQTFELFAGQTTTYKVECSGLLDATGAPIVPPRFATFSGVVPQVNPPGGVQLDGPVDLINFPTPRNPLGGTLQINSSGDYTTMQGRELLKKLIYRRLTTQPGEFAHLPRYGLGVIEKATTTPGALIKLRAEIERQTLLEPEVAQATASVTLSPDGVLLIKVQATLRADGATLNVGLQLPAAGTTY